MNKMKKRFGILIAVLVMVGLTGTGVFALEGDGDAVDPQAQPADLQEIDAASSAEQTKGTTYTEGTSDTTELINIADAVIQPIKDHIYKKGKRVTLKDDELVVNYTDDSGDVKTLQINQDYAIKGYANNDKVGTATVTINGLEPNFTGTQDANFKIKKAAKPDPVSSVSALTGYNAIKLVWKAPKDKSNVDYYFIERKLKGKVNRTHLTDSKENKCCEWENVYKLKKGKKYKYTIYAVNQVGKQDTAEQLMKGTGDDVKSKAMTSDKAQMAPKMYIKVTMKTTIGKLKSGKTYKAKGYGSGQYKIPYKGHTYSIARVKVRNQKAIYQKNGKYSREAVNFFMNGGKRWAKATKKNKYIYSFVKSNKFSTKRRYFVWINTYNQHAYVLKKNGKKWKCVDDWKVSMGTASTPSPTGNRTIIKYRAYHPGHGAPYWNFITWSSYMQHGTALHGLESGWAKKLGTLASHGCIRNPSQKAKALHEKYSGNGMKVIIW